VSYQVITGVSALNDAYVNFNGLATGEYIIYLNSAAEVDYRSISDEEFSVAGVFGGNIQLVDLRSTVVGACKLDWDADAKTLQFTGVDGGAGTQIPVDINTAAYYKLYSSDPLNWIIVYVATDPGVTDSLPFTTSFSEVVILEQSRLKLCSVAWNNTTELLSDLHDLRRFNTSDIRKVVEEEHDEYGQHSKVIHNPFRVAGLNDTAIFASAGSYGLHAEGGNPTEAVNGTGVEATGYGKANATAVGVYGYASNDKTGSSVVGVLGSALTRHGVYGKAATLGVVGSAADVYGVQGYAGTATGVHATAASNYAVYASVSNIAPGPGYGADIYALSARASATNAGVGKYAIGGRFEGVHNATVSSAVGVMGVVDGAGATAVYGYAPTGFGVFGSAGNIAVQGIANTLTGVYGKASGKGVVGIATDAAGDLGGSFAASRDVGVAGYAVGSCGGSFVALINTGVYGYARSNLAGYFEAKNSGAAYGAAVTGLWAYASMDSAAGAQYAYGLRASAINKTNPNQAIAMEGVVDGIGATGAVGYAVSGTGVYGHAGALCGIYGVAISNYGIWGTVSNNNNIYPDPIIAIAGSATGSNPKNVIGIYGEAVNVGTADSAIGVLGYAAGSTATGAAGSAAKGTGLYGAGSIYGGYFVCSAGGINGITAFGHTIGVGASADHTGLYGKGATYGVYCDGPLGVWVPLAAAGPTTDAIVNCQFQITVSGNPVYVWGST
jgi:hypothetical protein